jgi:hypothetical protein
MPKYTMAQLMAPSSEWEVPHAHRENFMQELAMIIVAAPHVCNFLWLIILRSSHGILCAFGTSIALEAAILWWFLSHQGKNSYNVSRFEFKYALQVTSAKFLQIRLLASFCRRLVSHLQACGSSFVLLSNTGVLRGRGKR